LQAKTPDSQGGFVMLDIVRQRRPAPWPLASGASRVEEGLFGWEPFFAVEALFTSDLFFPALDVSESEDAYLFQLDVPGLGQEDLEVTVTDRRLTIAGQRDLESSRRDGRMHSRERRSGRFSRSFELPADADPDQLSARLRQGILSVRCGKQGARAGQSWLGQVAGKLKGLAQKARASVTA
jgi:HSP20 family protein